MMFEDGKDQPLPHTSYADLSACSDEELIRQLQLGNGDALAVLFQRYQRLVFSVAIKILHDIWEAEDLTQSAFMEIFRSASLFDANRGTPKTWILQYAYHMSLNRRRHLSIRRFYSAEEMSTLPLLEMIEVTPGDLTLPEKRRLVAQALSSLNDVQRQVLEQAFFDGFTLKEIAEKMGETFSNVRHHYYRGMAKIRSQMIGPAEERCQVSSTEALDAQA